MSGHGAPYLTRDVTNAPSNLLTEREKDVELARDPTAKFVRYGYGAVLRCPLLEMQEGGGTLKSNGSDHDSEQSAQNDLRSVAAAVICRNCTLSSMPPEMVYTTLATRAEARRAWLEEQLALERVQRDYDTAFGDQNQQALEGGSGEVAEPPTLPCAEQE